MRKNKFGKIFLVFILAFLTNLVWENLHAQLYVHYKNGPITEAILLQATFVDACIISLLAFGFYFLSWLKGKYSLVFIVGVLIAIGIEWFALSTGRWFYKELMPIIPILKTGLTPTIQLGLLGCLSIFIVSKLPFLSEGEYE